MSGKDWRPTAFVDTAPGAVPGQEPDGSHLAQRRSVLAFIRHLSTLATAALVLTVTLSDKAFAQPLRREAVTVAVGAFLLSLIAGGLSSLVLIGNAPRHRSAWLASALATLLAFLVGAAALSWFFFANWLR